jgi:glucuronoarabinoxylan endo-1,4-beta-xylanase
MQNYPNPFNPSTVISYQLPVTGYVTLKIYDLLGSEIATLVNGEIEAGYHEVNFDASKLSSGIYFYRLQAGNVVDMKKVILMK